MLNSPYQVTEPHNPIRCILVEHYQGVDLSWPTFLFRSHKVILDHPDAQMPPVVITHLYGNAVDNFACVPLSLDSLDYVNYCYSSLTLIRLPASQHTPRTGRFL